MSQSIWIIVAAFVLVVVAWIVVRADLKRQARDEAGRRARLHAVMQAEQGRRFRGRLDADRTEVSPGVYVSKTSTSVFAKKDKPA